MVSPAALGEFSTPVTPGFGAGPIRTNWGTLLPPGGRVAAVVSSTGPTAYDEPEDRARQVTTLAEAVQMCRSGYPDVIRVKPGHTETVADATIFANLKAGTRIIGEGHGSLRPTFTFSATASQMTLDQANVEMHNLRFVAGANGVVNGIDITAADCSIENCEMILASASTTKFTIGISVSAARVRIRNNKFLGTATHNVTDGILVDTAVDGVEICNNVMLASATAANGLIRVTAAALNLLIMGNTILNSHTASTACIAIGDVAATGIIAYNNVATINDGTTTAQGITFGTAALLRAFQNFSSDEPKLSGLLTPAAAT